MEKGKYGVIVAFYAALAFILAILGQTLLCGLLLGFVLVAEKNEWAVKQVIQAFFLSFIGALVSAFTNVFSVFYAIPIIGTGFSAVIGFISGIISLIILVFAVMALIKVVKGKDAKVPAADKFANWAYGLVVQKVYTTTEVISTNEVNNAE